MGGSGLARRFVDDIVTSPVNICLVALICYFSYKLMRKDTGSLKKDKNLSTKKPLEKMPKQDFSLEQLRQYDGTNTDGRLLMGVLGRVFDVSAASDFYGPGMLNVNNNEPKKLE